MPFTLTMPKMSPTMEEGMIAKWHKRPGEFVKADELLFEVATDKATVEYNALDEGWLRKVIIQEGQTASINQAVAIFTEQKEESIEGYQPEGIGAVRNPVTETSEDQLALAEQSKAEQSKAEHSKAEQPKEEKAKGGKSSAPESLPPAASQHSLRQPSFKPERPLENFLLPPEKNSQDDRIKVSPLARKLAMQKGLDLRSVKGTGPGGRVVSRDLAGARPSLTSVNAFRGAPTEVSGSYSEESLSPMRKVISQRLQDAKSFIPHFYVSMIIDADPLIQIREQLLSHQIKLTYNDFVVRASALALQKHPHVNSGFNSAANSVIRFKTIDISIAVTVQGGLITPIIRYADYKNIMDISSEIKALARRAKESKLEAHEYKGGSFTISNLGMYGVSDFAAIINPPQAAILAVSGIRQVPVIRNGAIVPGNEMTLTLSVDHRVVDGVAGAEFLGTLKKLLETPAILLTS